MKRITFKFFLIVMVIFIAGFIPGYAKTTKTDEKRFQIGLGLLITTSDIMGIIDNARMYQSLNTNEAYTGTNTAEYQMLQTLSPSLQRGILVANILGSMEYGAQIRILWHIMMGEVNLMVMPYDFSNSGRVDLLVTMMMGIRAPFFIMPYFLAGATFTFSFYPDKITTVDNWRGNWCLTDNFMWRPGIETKFGLDFKFKNFSIGAYYQYTIKDFQEISYWYEKFKTEGINEADVVSIFLGKNSRFGIAMNFYLF